MGGRMSLYNMLFGQNPFSQLLKSILELDVKRENSPEFPKNKKGEEWYPYEDGLTKEGEKYIKKCNMNIYNDGNRS